MSVLGILRPSNPTSAAELAPFLEEPTIEDIRHQKSLGSTAYGDMLDAVDEALHSSEGFTLMGLFKVTRTLGPIQEGSVIRIDQENEKSATQGLGKFVLTVDTGGEAVVYRYPNFTGYIANQLVAAEGLSRLLLGGQSDPHPHIESRVIYPDNHVV